MFHDRRGIPFLETPKGVFLLGFLMGAMAFMSVGFLIMIGLNLKNAPTSVGAAPTAAPSVQPGANDQPAPPAADPRKVSKTDHILGSGPLTIITYTDLECPFCKRFHEAMLQIMQDDKGKVRWVMRHFPLTQLHSKSEKEAEASECAGEQGKFWEFVDKVFEVTPSNDGLDPAQLPVIAQQAGVKDIGKFNSCLSSGKYADRVQSDAQDAVNAGGEGTPYSVILGSKGDKRTVPGAFSAAQMQAVIDAMGK